MHGIVSANPLLTNLTQKMKSISCLTRLPALLITAAAAVGIARADTLTLTGVVRDFLDTHPDFESVGGFDLGIVETTLGVDGKPVYTGESGNPTTHGQTAFDQWYRDVPGVNLSTPLSITLDNGEANPGGIYTFADSTFFPIDGALFGNQGRLHNFHFTFELHTEFTYEAGQVFSFTGDDDLWVFINKQLAIDLGGVHSAMSASVNLDTLGLTPGADYDLDLFFAERHTSASNFRIDTSIVLRNEPPPSNGVPEISSTLYLLATSLLLVGAGRNKVCLK
jgi:fibro-slime domain-containing protein